MILDLGTGDGRAVLAAAADPRALVLGIDAMAAPMAEASRRAARPARKGGHPNALFLVESVEALPAALAGTADLVTVTFPWGSLLRGVLGIDPAVAAALTRLPKPGGRIEAVVSVTPRDGIEGLPCLDDDAVGRIAAAHAANGLRLVEACPATTEELRATGSTWAKRLGAARPAWRLTLERRR